MTEGSQLVVRSLSLRRKFRRYRNAFRQGATAVRSHAPPPSLFRNCDCATQTIDDRRGKRGGGFHETNLHVTATALVLANVAQAKLHMPGSPQGLLYDVPGSFQRPPEASRDLQRPL